MPNRVNPVRGRVGRPPLPPSGGRKIFRVGRRFFWSILYNIVNIIEPLGMSTRFISGSV